MKRIVRVSLALSLITSLFTVANPAPASAAYAFSSHTFTPCSAVGVNGPAQSSCRSAYSTTWDESDANFTVVSGIQIWTVPATGSYSIRAAGAVGGTGRGTAGGSGAEITGTFSLTEGTKIRILVGQSGTDYSLNGGGGGASWVVKESDNTTAGIYVIAGGGGGGGYNANGTNINAVTTNSGQPGWHGNNAASLNNAVSGGNGGINNDRSGSGGGGFSGNGGSSSNGCSNGGTAFTSGGTGGSGTAAGGFGGGGASEWCTWTGGGGGGGYSGGSGGYWYGSGGGGGSYNNGSNQTNTGASNSATGFVTITSLGPELTTFTSSPAITNASTLSYTVNFGQSVTGLSASDFSVSGSGSSGCSVGTPSGSGTNYTVAISGCSPGTVILTLATNSVVNSSSQSGPTSNNIAGTVVIDRTAPTISSVSAPTNATYKPADTPTFTVAFSESVTVTGTPRLTLTVGSTTEYATYVSMSDSKTALFRYTVASDPIEFDIDGITLATTLDLNSGTIQDLATNSLNNLSLTAPTLTSVFVAQPAAAPTIDSITATSGQLAIYFTPGSARGSTTSTYQYSTNGSAFANRASGTTASPLLITGLTNGTGYTIRIRATTNAGAGDSSTAATETPTAIAVTGDITLTLTFGSSASTSAYQATGGTNTYTWSLGSSLTGVTLSGTTVTAGSTTPAGTYTQTVRATDGNSQVGSKTLNITVNKASTSISIALPNSSASAALGGAVTITATVPRAGAVNFRLGGTTISGCGSATAATTSATCSWTPNSLGSVSLTAIFTPTDSSNFETSTTTTLSITVVNGVSSVTLSLAGGTLTPAKSQAINIIAAVDQAGRLTVTIDGKRLLGCTNILVSVGNANCAWKPSIQKSTIILARLVPTNTVFNNSTSSLRVQVVRRTGRR